MLIKAIGQKVIIMAINSRLQKLEKQVDPGNDLLKRYFIILGQIRTVEKLTESEFFEVGKTFYLKMIGEQHAMQKR